MKGLLLKDIYNLKSQFLFYAIFAIAYTAAFAMSTEISMLLGVVVLMVGMLPLTAISYDERAKWDKYGLTMPVTQKESVAAKYLLVLILLAVSMLLMTAAIFVSGNEIQENLITLLIISGMTFFYVSVLVPMVYKMGSERARFLMIAVIFAPVILLFFGLKFVKSAGIGIDLSWVTERAVQTGALAFLFLCLVLLYISYRISVRIYSAKEW